MGKRHVTKRQALHVWVGCSMVLILASLPGFAQGKRQPLVKIEHEPFNYAQVRGAPLLIEARITSPAGIRVAKVYYRKPGEHDFTALTMRRFDDEVYRAVVPDWGTIGPSLEYYITAVDLLGSKASRGFFGFPLTVRLRSGRGPTRQERLDALENTLQILRKQREAGSSDVQPGDPSRDN